MSKTEYKKSRWTVYLNSTQAGKLSVVLSHVNEKVTERTHEENDRGKKRQEKKIRKIYSE
jgi:hypothetical protein